MIDIIFMNILQKKIFEDQVNCLQVNLTSAEELLIESQVNMDRVRAGDTTADKRYEEFAATIKGLNDDNDLLKAQVNNKPVIFYGNVIKIL